jgi:hypothetical protein
VISLSQAFTVVRRPGRQVLLSDAALAFARAGVLEAVAIGLQVKADLERGAADVATKLAAGAAGAAGLARSLADRAEGEARALGADAARDKAAAGRAIAAARALAAALAREVVRKAAAVVRAVARVVAKAAVVVGKAAVAVAKVAYKVSGVQSIVSCVTDPGLSSCLQAALTVALVVGTAGSGEIADIAAEGALDAAEDAGAAAAEDTAEATAEKTGTDTAESCSLGGESFTASTKVLLADGKAVPISALKPGEKVLATNTKTGRPLLRKSPPSWSTTTPTATTSPSDRPNKARYRGHRHDPQSPVLERDEGQVGQGRGAEVRRPPPHPRRGRSGWDRGRRARSRPPRWLDVGPHRPWQQRPRLLH